MIKFNRITKVFEHVGIDKVIALNSIDIHIKQSEFVVVIGTNGSGKSSFLNAIAGKFICDSGEIILDDKDVTKKPEYRRADIVGRVFQNPFTGTSPSLSVIENLRIAELRGQRRGLTNGLTKHHRDNYLKLLNKLEMGLEHRIDATVGLLSGGQRQAITLLMATMRKPKILLLDEHTAALDPKAAEQIVKLTRKVVAENQLTTVMVTHSMSQALDLGNRTIMMHEGRIIGDLFGEERERTKTQDLLNIFNELRKNELLDDNLINLIQDEYY
ncbi:MAG: ATP-binding cassette domain-containing protein [Candidatus Cloacimonetes bacterium]|nr:ATP-binding cassette domain-containing protein [Candidatus Cloacimonadota bacterium]